MIKRLLELSSYKHSIFLFGPRQTGKTSLIQETLQPGLYIDLLKEGEFIRYANNPSLFSNEIRVLGAGGPKLVVVDEIQRLPRLLNEVHSLMEERKELRFVLTGSSARKLRAKGVNLLGGRAVTLRLHPFTHLELGDCFQLEEAIHFGTLPKTVLEPDKAEKRRLLKSYVETYLKEEIQQEALTRNVPAFSRFLELAAFENGNILNYSSLAREVGVEGKTIKEYFQILEDTLVGFSLPPFVKSHRTRIVSHPKFYFFDTGIVSALCHSLTMEKIPGTPPFGKAFEHWVLLEIRRLIDYREREMRLSFFRTSDGTEVDLILEKADGVWAVEIKSGESPRLADIRGLRNFIKDHKVDRALCVCQTPRAYQAENIYFLPWRSFMEEV